LVGLTTVDYGSELVIWGTAESAVTIVAASIPMLRTLFREVKSKAGYGSNNVTTKRSKIGRTTVVVTADRTARGEDGHHVSPSNNKGDDRSDRSILHVGGNAIVQTSEIRVESHGRVESDSEYAYELDPV